MANTPTQPTPPRPGDKPTQLPKQPTPPRKPGDKDDDDDDDARRRESRPETGELATEPVTTTQQRVFVERGRSGGAQRTGAAGDLSHEDDPSHRATLSGRRAKSPTPGVPETYEDLPPVDPAAFDPRIATEGTPIAFPDPDEPYPQEGTPYPPPVDAPVRVGKRSEHSLDAETGKRLDAEGKVVEETGPRGGQTAAASGEANLAGKPSRQFDVP